MVIVLHPASFDEDRRGFQMAAADYALLKKRITMLGSTEGISLQAGMKGHGVAQSVAYGICLATVYVNLKSYFHL